MDFDDIANAVLVAVGRGLQRGLLGREAHGESAKEPATARAAAPRGLRPGANVYYRQGRGRFLARVVSVDTTARKALVERATDGQRVIRPVNKLRPRRGPRVQTQAPPADIAERVRRWTAARVELVPWRLLMLGAFLDGWLDVKLEGQRLHSVYPSNEVEG